MEHNIEGPKPLLTAGRGGYEIVARHGAQSVDIRFAGTFEDREVVWAARVEVTRGRQFIEIRERRGSEVPLHIGLKLDVIDEPALAKTVIMIRRYKRLRRGRHEFGAI